jgi:hypothetical protein
VTNRNQQAELHTIAREVTSRERTIEALKAKTMAAAEETSTEVLLQGQSLSLAKEKVPRSAWDDWLAANIPLVPPARAEKYVTYARRVPLLRSSSANVNQLLLLFRSEDRQPEVKPKKEPWPVFAEGLACLERFHRFIERHPVPDWPNEAQDELFALIEIVRKKALGERSDLAPKS